MKKLKSCETQIEIPDNPCQPPHEYDAFNTHIGEGNEIESGIHVSIDCSRRFVSEDDQNTEVMSTVSSSSTKGNSFDREVSLADHEGEEDVEERSELLNEKTKFMKNRSKEHYESEGEGTELQSDKEVGKAEEQEEDDSDLPIDQGYAWMIVVGCFLNIILLTGYGRAIAILFIEYIRFFEASVSATTLFMGVITGSYSVAALFSMHMVLGLLGVRKTVLLGGTLYVIGMVTAIFAPSLIFLICTHSVLIGVSNSLIHGPALVMIGHYFKKKRARAMTMATSGVSLGGIIFPPLVRFLLDTYGLRGAMIVLTGISMNIYVGALLFRPLESFRKRKRTVKMGPSVAKNESKSVIVHLKQAFSHLDFSLFKRRNFRYILVFSPFAILVVLNSSYIPALAQEKGVSETKAALLLTILSSIDFVSRLTLGTLVDKGYIKVYNLMACGLLATGTVAQFTSFYNTYPLLVVFCVITGIFGSYFPSLLSVAIVEFMGVENMAKVIGFVALFQGMSGFVTHPVLGTLRDYTGSYVATFNYIGACAYIGAILLLFAPLIIEKKEKATTETN